VKCADITDTAFVAAVLLTRKVRSDRDGHDVLWVNRFDVGAVLAGHPEWAGQAEASDGSVEIPHKLVLAKARKVIRRKLIDGCPCGCRGDFEVTAAGRALLREE
jgi:hypothetical protein